jgi:phosphate:Na+ symporter
MQAIFSVLGGIGLFLIGMKLMTEALRDAAGPSLRAFVTRFTTTPLRGTLTGTAVTAVVQSSTATTVMTVGMVGAGVLTFPQALGMLYGANIGTTVTGWIVAFLGFKLKLGVIALPVLFVAALGSVLGRGKWGRFARALSGLCLLFIGLDMMQAGAGLAQDLITPDRLPDDDLAGRIALVMIGFVIVQIVQSSSAGMAMALVFLGAGAISFAQAAALVIGLNIGTTLTALLAAIGGGRAARQTAYANLLFNLGTAALAFPFLDLVSPVLHGTALGADDLTALVLFHTGFNLLGALVFLPVTARFAVLLDRLVPETGDALTAPLEPQLLSDAEAALRASKQVADMASDQLFEALASALAQPPDLRALASAPPRVAQAVDALEAYLGRITLPDGHPDHPARFAALLHQLDHLQRMTQRIERRSPLGVIATDPSLMRAAQALGAALTHDDEAHLPRLRDLIETRSRTYRHEVLIGNGKIAASVQDLFDRTDAMRWLAHLAEHALRIRHYRGQTGPAR